MDEPDEFDEAAYEGETYGDPHEEGEGIIVDTEAVWQLDFEDLEFLNVLGKGAYGVVMRGRYLGLEVAIKKIASADEEELLYIQRELNLLTALRHPCIVQFIGMCADPEGGLLLVTEFVAGGDLWKKLKKPEVEVAWSHKVKMACQIACAMAYLHRNSVIHRDLKAKNILVTEHWDVRVADFGLARSKTGASPATLTLCGTQDWMAPEMLMGLPYDRSVDLFSFGIVLCELITRRKITVELQRMPENAFGLAVDRFIELIPPDCPEEFAVLAHDCCQYDPADRPNFLEVISRCNEILEECLHVESMSAAAAEAAAKVEEEAAAMIEAAMLEMSGQINEDLMDQHGEKGDEEARMMEVEAARLMEEATRMAEKEAARLMDKEASRMAEEEATRLMEEEAARMVVEESTRLMEEEEFRMAEEEATRLMKEEAVRISAKEAARQATKRAEGEHAAKHVEAEAETMRKEETELLASHREEDLVEEVATTRACASTAEGRESDVEGASVNKGFSLLKRLQEQSVGMESNGEGSMGRECAGEGSGEEKRSTGAIGETADSYVSRRKVRESRIRSRAAEPMPSGPEELKEWRKKQVNLMMAQMGMYPDPRSLRSESSADSSIASVGHLPTTDVRDEDAADKVEARGEYRAPAEEPAKELVPPIEVHNGPRPPTEEVALGEQTLSNVGTSPSDHPKPVTTRAFRGFTMVLSEADSHALSEKIASFDEVGDGDGKHEGDGEEVANFVFPCRTIDTSYGGTRSFKLLFISCTVPPKKGADFSLTKTLVVLRDGQETAVAFSSRVFSKFVGDEDSQGRRCTDFVLKVDETDGDYVDGELPLINYLAVREPFSKGDRARLTMVPRKGEGLVTRMGENAVQARVRLARKQAEEARDERLKVRSSSSSSTPVDEASGEMKPLEWIGPFPRNPAEVALYKEFMKEKYAQEERVRKKRGVAESPKPQASPRIRLTMQSGGGQVSSATKQDDAKMKQAFIPHHGPRRGTLLRLKKGGKSGWKTSNSPGRKDRKTANKPVLGGGRDGRVIHPYPSQSFSDSPLAEAVKLLSLARTSALKADPSKNKAQVVELAAAIEKAQALAAALGQ